jgi:soluble lytic murein transglycosylase-like protein
MEQLLKKGLERTAGNLREALAYLYNRCQDVEGKGGPLTSANVKFVNHVFREFTAQSDAKTLQQFDLDKPHKDPTAGLSDGWRRAVGERASRYVKMVEAVAGTGNPKKPVVDVILFLALMRQESNFNHRDISSVGAAGLTQIMPRTAKDLGMTNIYMPEYLQDAASLLRKERRMGYRARSLISEITPENKKKLAAQAREWMQRALQRGEEARRLYKRYRQEVLEEGVDDRLDPRKAIHYGYMYFERMMKIHEGDISLALASYNAGPHRVEQYQGIPPYDETVSFRNRVLRYYREYLQSVERYREKDARSVH